MRISDWSSDVCSSDLIGGVEELKSDFQSNKPEISVRIDRERARREGISTAQIGLALRNALYGKEVSKFRDENDDYPIMVRLKESQRNNVNTLINMPITFRDANSGQRSEESRVGKEGLSTCKSRGR